MEQRVSLVTLGVADLERSRRFYEDGLGWRHQGQGGDDTLFFQTGGSIFALWQRDHMAADMGVPAKAGGFAGFTLAYNARSKADVDAVMAEAKAAGAKIVKPAHDTFWGGYSGYFADPDGHVWEAAWNPGWTIREDGSVSLKP